MKSNRLILGSIFAFWALLGGLFIAQKVFAFNNYGLGTGYFTGHASSLGDPHNRVYFTPNGGSQTEIFTDKGYRAGFVATSTATSTLGTFTQINQVSLFLRNETGSTVNLSLTDIQCSDANGTRGGSTDTVSIPVSTTFLVYNFKMSTALACDSATLNFLEIGVENQNLEFAGYDVIGLRQGIEINSGTGDGCVTACRADYNLIVSINDTLITPTSLNQSGSVVLNCPNTSFSVLGADFGQGFCELLRFLFVPNQNTLNVWSNNQVLLASTTPFSYLYDLSNILENISTSTATMTPLQISVGSGTPMSLTFDAFSANTVDRYTDSNSRSVVKTLIIYALWLMFVAMVILEVRQLFRKK